MIYNLRGDRTCIKRLVHEHGLNIVDTFYDNEDDDLIDVDVEVGDADCIDIEIRCDEEGVDCCPAV